LRGVTSSREVPVHFESFSFGSIRIDGVTYEHDVVIDRCAIRKRKKKASKQYRDIYGIHRSRPKKTSRGAAAGWW